MKADNISLQGILNSPNRYLIPVFQRYYSWGRKEWGQLWENIVELYEGVDDQPHFMGALVFVPDGYAHHTMPTYLVIDGQQRLVTLSLLMAALRNLARSHKFTTLAGEINDTYLMHPYKTGTEHYRVYPRQRDRDEYVSVLEHRSYRGTRGKITDGLIYFVRNIETLLGKDFSEADIRAFFELIKNQLEFVYITLDEENPYRIFKSLNSTGMNLSEADLIRNFMLMSVGTDTAAQDAFDDAYWRPLERKFEDEAGQLNSREFSIFFRDFLMSNGRYIPLSSTFFHFERRYGGADFQPAALALELQNVAQLYNIIRGFEAHAKKDINRALHHLRLLNSSGTYPLVLNLLLRVQDGTMSTADFVAAVESLRKFVHQLFEGDEAPRMSSLNRWFVQACKALGKKPLSDLTAYLKAKN